MTRTYYRLVLTVLCALAAYVGPVVFLKYPYRFGYFVGGLIASLLAWGLLMAVISTEQNLPARLQFVLGAGAGVFTWSRTSLVAVFHILPLIARNGWRLNDTFDPVWLMGGLAPLVVPVVALLLSHTTNRPFWQTFSSALFRYSIPLAILQLLPRWIGLPRQFTWIFLFTGVMFLVLDGLGTGRDFPFLSRLDPSRR